MLSDNEQAEAYALVTDSMDELAELLNAMYIHLDEKDWERAKNIGDMLATAQDILDV